ncbi:hypothetical protein B7494_g347 [Chlorociboria aeruginascens]|nr:hypothetical protein B7494_g347 [Chlorociboria aeruginascens]
MWGGTVIRGQPSILRDNSIQFDTSRRKLPTNPLPVQMSSQTTSKLGWVVVLQTAIIVALLSSIIKPELQGYVKPYFSTSSITNTTRTPRICSNSSRFPPIPPSAQTPAQQKGHEEIQEVMDKLYTPSIAASFTTVAHHVINYPILSLRERELAILATVSYKKAEYAIYAHSRIAAAAGLTPSQVGTAREGRLPEGLSEREETAYVFAQELITMRGPLSDEVFEKTEKVFGKEEMASIVHLVGSFSWSSILMNAADVCAPEENY